MIIMIIFMISMTSMIIMPFCFSYYYNTRIIVIIDKLQRRILFIRTTDDVQHNNFLKSFMETKENKIENKRPIYLT